jgi:hypothetical protein
VVVVVASVVVVVGAVVVVVDGAMVEVVAALVVVGVAGGRVVGVVAEGGLVVGVVSGEIDVGGVSGPEGMVNGVVPGPGVPLRAGRPDITPSVVVAGVAAASMVVAVSEEVLVVDDRNAVVEAGAASNSGVSPGWHDLTGSRSGSATSPKAPASTYTTFPGPRPSRRARWRPSSVTPTTWTVSPRIRRPMGGSPGQAVIGATATTTPAVSYPAIRPTQGTATATPAPKRTRPTMAAIRLRLTMSKRRRRGTCSS